MFPSSALCLSLSLSPGIWREFLITGGRSPPLFSLTPQDEAGVAVVGGPGAVDVGTLEVGHLDEAVLGRLRVVALHL